MGKTLCSPCARHEDVWGSWCKASLRRGERSFSSSRSFYSQRNSPSTHWILGGPHRRSPRSEVHKSVAPTHYHTTNPGTSSPQPRHYTDYVIIPAPHSQDFCPDQLASCRNPEKYDERFIESLTEQFTLDSCILSSHNKYGGRNNFPHMRCSLIKQLTSQNLSH